MKLLHLPAYLPRVGNYFPLQVCRQLIKNQPLHATVRGSQLEESEPKGHLLHPYLYPWLQPPAGGSRAW